MGEGPGREEERWVWSSLRVVFAGYAQRHLRAECAREIIGDVLQREEGVLRRRWLSRGNIIGFGTSCGAEMRARESRVVRGAGDMGLGVGSSSG